MAASMLSWRLSNSFGSFKCISFQSIETLPRVLTSVHTSQLQPNRGRRRSCRAPSWFVQRKVDKKLYGEVLTADNRQFMKDVAIQTYNERMANSPLKEAPVERCEFKRNTMRTGVLAIKIGVIPQWTTRGQRFHCTLLQVLDNHVIRYMKPEDFMKASGYKEKWTKRPLYGSMVVGALSCDPFSFSAAYNNLFAEAGVPPKRKLTRFLVTPDAALAPGTPLKATHFRVGDYVDCQAKSIGHGFQGVVKRWGFKGGPASHGTTKWHRRPGSIGGGGDKSGVWKGKKMAGHMGMDWSVLRGLQIMRINTKYNVLYVKGQNVAGPNHCYVRIYDSSLRHRARERLDNPPPMPTFYPEDATEPLPEEFFDEKIFRFSQPTITFDDKEQ